MKRVFAALALVAALTFSAAAPGSPISPGVALASCGTSPPQYPGGWWLCNTFHRTGSFWDAATGVTVATWTYDGSYWYDNTLYLRVINDTSDGWSGYGHSSMSRNAGYPSLSIVLTSYWSACVHSDSLNRCDTWQWSSIYTFNCPDGQVIPNVSISVEATRTGYTTQSQIGNMYGCMR